MSKQSRGGTATTSSRRTSSILTASASRPSSQHVKKKKSPSTAGSTNKRKSASPTTPARKVVDHGVQNQDYPTVYRPVSLKDEKDVLLNEEEMIKDFERQKRRFVSS